MEYQLSAIRDERGLLQLGADWTRLLLKSPAATIFATFEWNLAWWHHFGAGKELFVVVARDQNGQLRGIAPLMLTPHVAGRKLEFIGTGLSDNGDFILDPDTAGSAAAALLAYLQRRARGWDLANLDEVPAYSPLAAWLAADKAAGSQLIMLPRTECPYISIPATWQDYTRKLAKKPRQHLEGYSRRIVEENGIEFRLVTQPEDTPAAVERFYKLHLARWQSKDAALNPEHLDGAFLPFLHEACLRSAQAGWLRIAELCVGDSSIAAWISFNVGGRWNGYMTGMDPAWSASRPGKILHGFVMKAALAEQAHELDFGRGSEEYKYEMGATDRRSWRFVLAAPSPRGALAFGLTNLRLIGRDLVRKAEQARARPSVEAQPAEAANRA